MHRVLRGQTDFRSSTLRNQLTSLVLYESVTTTQTKAKELVQYANHFFNRVKSVDLSAKKLAHQLLTDPQAVKKLFEELLGRYKSTETTLVRSYKVANRRGDSAPMAIVMLIRGLTTEAKPAASSTTDKSPTKTSDAKSK